MVRGKYEVPDILPVWKAETVRHRCKFMTMEDVAFQKGMIQYAQREVGFVEVIPLKRSQDKLSRAIPALNRCAGGKLYVLESASWREEAEGELIRFTGINDAYDDIVDTVSDAAEILSRYEPPSTKPALPQLLRSL
jgi:predicted phage terminase large subunit-like protein